MIVAREWRDRTTSPNDVSQPFTPTTIDDVAVHNRVWVAPTCQHSAAARPSGRQAPRAPRSFARGGAGLFFTEATADVPEGRISSQDTGLWTDKQQDGWAPRVCNGKEPSSWTMPFSALRWVALLRGQPRLWLQDPGARDHGLALN